MEMSTVHMDRMTRARACLALQEAVSRYLFDPNVSLIDFGHPEHGGRIAENELAIRIHVRKKLSDFGLEAAVEAGHTRPIPSFVRDFPTDVPQGTYRLRQWWGGGRRRRRGWRRRQRTTLRARRANPLRGGISISDAYHHVYGSLGGLVVDRTTGEEMMLSNWHVLVVNWGARRGQWIYQPGRRDGGTRADVVATLTRDAMSVNLDAAVATLTGSRQLVNDQIGLGPVRGVRQAELGMEVVKSGRQTGITYGRVTAIEGIAKMRYGHLYRIIRNVVTIDQRQRFEPVSAGGDSGSWWLDGATRRAVGLHFAGCNRPERALAMDMQSVLDALDVELVAAARSRVQHRG